MCSIVYATVSNDRLQSVVRVSMNHEERLQCRRELYRLHRDRETPEQADERHCRHRERMRRRRAALTQQERLAVLHTRRAFTVQ